MHRWLEADRIMARAPHLLGRRPRDDNRKTFLPAFFISSLIGFIFVMVASVPAREGPELKKISRNVYAFIGEKGNANSGFILTPEGIIVIDAQMNEPLAKRLLTEIRRLSDRPILYLINTHYHGDHTFGNHVFSPQKGIIAHENTIRFLKKHGQEHLEQFKAFFGPDQAEGIKVTVPTLSLKDALTLSIGGLRIELLHPGLGHTNGDIIVYLPTEKILFAGDLVYAGRVPWLGDGNTRAWLKSLERIESLEFNTLIPGHGKIGGRSELKRFERYLTDLRAAVLRALLKGHSLDQMKNNIRLPDYQEDLKYEEWLPLHIEKVYREMQEGESEASGQ